MKNSDKIMSNIDATVDHIMTPVYGVFKKYFRYISTVILTFFFLFFFIRTYNSKPQYLASIIKEDLLMINYALNRIDKECSIISIRSDNAAIDFLTVQKFVGSSVGCLNLAFPENWHGAYLQVSPTYQSKPYEIVRGIDGFFLVPGTGVVLPNNKIMGKDIVINESTNVGTMLTSTGALTHGGSQLGLKITFKIGDIHRRRIAPETVAKINGFLNEFNSALPYAYNDYDYELQTPLKQRTL